MIRFKKVLPMLVVFITCLLAVFPLFYSGLLPTHDGEYHIIRFYEFDKTLRDGSVYPVWAPDLNFKYGLPLFNYVYPLPNYVASFLHLFGTSFIDAFKINMILASFVGAFGMYFWVSAIYGKKSGVVSAIFYTFAPYHLLDVYVRGSVGELWALGLFPVFLHLLHKGLSQKNQKYCIVAGITFALIIFSHNILAVMFTFFALTYSVYLILQAKDRRPLLRGAILSFGLGLLLSSIFWMPALIEKKFVVGLNTSNIESNFPELFQLLIPSWGSGFSGSTLENQMSFQIGIANLFVVMLAFCTLFLKRVKIQDKKLILSMLTWFALLIFMILEVSAPVWKLPLLNNFQFSWRLLSIVILVSAFLAGYLVSVIKNKIFLTLIIILAIATTYSYTKPPYYFNRNDAYYTSRPNFIYGTNSPGNIFNTKWNLARVAVPSSVVNSYSKNARIEKLYSSPTRHTFEVVTKARMRIRMNLSYFPGWEVRIDQKNVVTRIEKDGTFSFTVPKGRHAVMVSFTDSKIRLYAKLMTISGIFFILFTFKARKLIQ